jgi:hypothetical protein
MKKALFTMSCARALPMSAILLDIQLGNLLIVFSFTFICAPDAYVLRAAHPFSSTSTPTRPIWTIGIDPLRKLVACISLGEDSQMTS